MLRQQVEKGQGEPNRSLADFIAPAETGLSDHIGAFAVTGGVGTDELVKRYEAELDDYRAIMVKALADRLAEAFAEYLHEVARREWYEKGPRHSREDLIGEKYRGIRPAFGYPACPDHSEKPKLVELLEAERAGIALTETFSMTPAGVPVKSRPMLVSRLISKPESFRRPQRCSRRVRSGRTSDSRDRARSSRRSPARRW
jgi:5-methyltetrahydrofolate--homocysteine methyltransferase